jgi:hypothetical protein
MNNQHSKVAGFLVACLLTLAGCSSTAPLSLVEGVPWTRTDSNLYPVRVVSVDRDIQFNRPDEPIRLSPGPRWLVLEAAPGEGARRHVQKSFVLRVEPCTHYYLAARRTSPMQADWELVIDMKEPVAGCKPEEELKKAGLFFPASGASAPK